MKDADADADGDEEDGEDEEDEDDQGEGSPRGKKRARANTTGDSVPGGSQVPQRVQVKTQPRDTDGYVSFSHTRFVVLLRLARTHDSYCYCSATSPVRSSAFSWKISSRTTMSSLDQVHTST